MPPCVSEIGECLHWRPTVYTHGHTGSMKKKIFRVRLCECNIKSFWLQRGKDK